MNTESPDASVSSNELRPEILAILRCPITLSQLRQEGDWLIAETGGLSYPVRDGIPVMLPEEAKLPPGMSTLDDFRKRYAR
ncbi:MAG: Trm112 family protein [Anaerolineae bacterium]|nr:Trm112 family protein [Phycisphaerae bacterium]